VEKMLGRHLGYFMGALLIVLYFLAYQLGNPWIEIFELKTLDLRYQVRGEKKIDPHVVIVAIDEESLAKMSVYYKDEWPWQRHHYGRLLRKLFEYGAKAVAFDISFTTPDEVNPKSDSYLASVLLAMKNVVLGTYIVFDKQVYESYPEELKDQLKENIHHLQFVFKMENFEYSSLIRALSVYKIIPPIVKFSSVVPSAVFEIGELDVDSVVRNLPLFVREDWALENGLTSGYLPHMDVLAAALYLGVDPKELIVDFKSRSVKLGSHRIAFDSNGIFQLYYYGDAVFPEYSFYDVVYGQSDYADAFKDKVVLLGYTTSAKGLYDLRSTPFNPNTAGVHIHATAIENFIRGDTLTRLPFWVRILTVLSTALLAALLSSFQRVWLNFSSLSIPALTWVLSYYLFLDQIWLDTFYPMFAGLAISVINISANFYREHAEKRRLRNFFYRYVPDTVADMLVKKKEVKLGGEKKRVVILFSDVKGFTSFSETKDPELVVNVLNRYLTSMAEIIRNRYGGTIDKFVGDAIMAIFGAPITTGNEHERALMCALDMREALDKLNEELSEEFGALIKLDSGIGIHEGEALIGNIGAPFRMDYTAIGDAVNTASRIEHLTREMKAEIIVSEDIVKNTETAFRFEFLGEYAVKGKAEPLRLYSLLGRKGT